MRPDFDSPGTFGHLVFLGMEAAAMDKAAMTTPTRAARRHQLSELRSELASTSRTTSTAQVIGSQSAMASSMSGSCSFGTSKPQRNT